MFRTWIVRQCNPVWVCKLADSVTSLDSNSYKGSIECDTYLESLESLINTKLEKMGIYECKQVIGFLLTWRLLQQQNEAKYVFV